MINIIFSEVLPRDHQFLSIVYPIGATVVIREFAANLGLNGV